MDDHALIDGFVEAEIGPFGGKLMAAMRRGDLCVRGHVEGDHVQRLRGDEQWFDKPIGQWDDLVYFQRSWVMESRVVRELKRLMGADVKQIDMGSNKGLNEGQREAARKGLGTSVFCLSGGPGTGKTHTVGVLVRAFLDEGDVVVAAPTGKAAREMQRRIGGDVEARTLHGLLGIRDAWDVLYGKTKIETGMVIVDECSMIDVGMWGALLSAVSTGTRVVLVGDHDQLPPVEAGTVYGEICGYLRERHRERYVHLDECMRSDRREILEMAEKVKRGEVIEGKPLGRDFDVTKWMDAFRGDGVKGFRILSCLREGPFGVKALNERLFEAFREERRGEDVWKIPVMVTRTDYEMGVCNGDMGILLKRSKGRGWDKEDLVEFEDRSVPVVLLPEFEVAYAISVHKSQGSEYDRVLLVVPSGAENFGREVLYTGITRARVSLEVYGDKATLKACSEKSTMTLSGIRRKLEC